MKRLRKLIANEYVQDFLFGVATSLIISYIAYERGYSAGKQTCR